MWGKKSDKQIRTLGKARAEVEKLKYFFMLQLCGLWTVGQACLDKYTIILYHLSV